MSPTRRQTKRDIQKTPIIAHTAGACSSIYPKLCMLIKNVVTIILKGVNHFRSKAQFFLQGKNADFWSLTHWVNLLPSGCHGNLPVIKWRFLTSLSGMPVIGFISCYRQDAAKRQTAGIVFTHRPKIRFFATQGRLVAPIQVKLCSTDGHLGPLGCA